MNCRDVEERLDAYLEETLPAEECRDLQAHVDSCAACGRLLGIARGQTEMPDGPRGLAESVFERTSGSPCVRARELLCAHVDGQLSAAETDLLRRHLDHCPVCAALSAGLSELRIELPAMADIQPDPFFSTAVIRRLSGLGIPAADRQSRVRRWWANVVRRPRFSWEVAYVATLLLVLAVGNPFSQSYGSSLRESMSAAAWARASRHVPQFWETLEDRGGNAAVEVALEISGGWSAAERFASAVREDISEVKASVVRMLREAMRYLGRSIRKKPTGETQRSAELRRELARGELFLCRCVNADERMNRYGG